MVVSFPPWGVIICPLILFSWGFGDFCFHYPHSMIPVFNCLGVNGSLKRGVLREACLRGEGQGTGTEKSPKHSGSPLAPDDLRGDENKILILSRGFCCAQKRENGGLACAASQILSARLPLSILALVLTSVLFAPLTIANPLLLQFFLSPSFPFVYFCFSISSQK